MVVLKIALGSVAEDRGLADGDIKGGGDGDPQFHILVDFVAVVGGAGACFGEGRLAEVDHAPEYGLCFGLVAA